LVQVLITLLPLCVTFVLSLGQPILTGEPNDVVTSLHLTQPQIQQIKSIETQYRDRTTQFDQELRQLELEVTQLMISSAPAAEVREKERSFEALKLKAAQVYFEKFLAMREVLTPNQLLKQCEPFALNPEQLMERYKT
jgi:Spy/CpxP family protein refolding chaperone